MLQGARPTPGSSGAVTAAPCFTQSWSSRLFGRCVHVGAALFPLSEEWAVKMVAKEHVGSWRDAGGRRTRCFLPHSDLDESDARTSCSRRSRSFFSLCLVGREDYWQRKWGKEARHVREHDPRPAVAGAVAAASCLLSFGRVECLDAALWTSRMFRRFWLLAQWAMRVLDGENETMWQDPWGGRTHAHPSQEPCLRRPGRRKSGRVVFLLRRVHVEVAHCFLIGQRTMGVAAKENERGWQNE